MNRESEVCEPVVLLVDSKTRDLDVAALISLHLRELGVVCHLEPLEAFRAVLAAYRPGMVIFNHLTASHLVAWSKRLAEIGVLTAVLPNEGIAYDQHDLNYLAGRHHRDAHIDFIFAWNEPYRQAAVAERGNRKTDVEVVGIPRFDFYFEPWSQNYERLPATEGSRPRILLCTNFVAAKFKELPRIEGDKLFAQWVGRIPLYDNYRDAIEAHWRARIRLLDYLQALLITDKFEVVLRPHPREDLRFYSDWIAVLPTEHREQLRFAPSTPISSLILDCDLEISCETCTTAMESWIAGKPTVELIFERNPLWYRQEQAQCNVECADPARLPSIVEHELNNPRQPARQELRRKHLEKWAATPDGRSSLKLAQTVARAIQEKKRADWSKLDASDYRRAVKLHTFRRLGLAYHYDPLLALKRSLFVQRYAVKDEAYRKSIKPRDVAVARRQLEGLAHFRGPA